MREPRRAEAEAEVAGARSLMFPTVRVNWAVRRRAALPARPAESFAGSLD